MKRTPERERFLADVLTTAVEHQGYGFFHVLRYRWDCPPVETYALIEESPDYVSGDEAAIWRIDIETTSKGLGVIRGARYAAANSADPHAPGANGEVAVLFAADGKRLYFGGQPYRDLMLADRTNGAEGDFDVIAALAVVECALFGQVVYA